MNVLACVREVMGRTVKVTNASSFYEGMPVSVSRASQNIGATEISYVREKRGELVLRNDLGVIPGYLLNATYGEEIV